MELSFSGCLGASGRGGRTGAAPDTAAPDVDTAKWYACAAPADCAPVEIGCCDHCNGGKAIAANKQYAAQVKVALTPVCDMVACTEKGCAPVQTTCSAGQCVVATCEPTEPGKLCVPGIPSGAKEILNVGDPVAVTVYPKGSSTNYSITCRKKGVASRNAKSRACEPLSQQMGHRQNRLDFAGALIVGSPAVGFVSADRPQSCLVSVLAVTGD